MAVSDEQILDAQYRVEDTKHDWDVFRRCINTWITLLVLGLGGIFGGAFASDIGLGSGIATALLSTGVALTILCGLAGFVFLFVISEDMPSFRSDFKKAERDYQKLMARKASETLKEYDRQKEQRTKNG